jgi:hypothetical protein
VLLQREVDARGGVADPLLRRVVCARVEGLEERSQSRHEPPPLPSVGVGARGLDPLRNLELLLRSILQPVEPHLELVYRHLRVEPGHRVEDVTDAPGEGEEVDAQVEGLCRLEDRVADEAVLGAAGPSGWGQGTG